MNDGSSIGPYVLESVLGRGGMGIVHRVRHRTSGSEAALKTIVTFQDGALAGIRREIYALSRLRHPGIVRIVDEGMEDGKPWYAMELLTGPSLRSLLRDARRELAG